MFEVALDRGSAASWRRAGGVPDLGQVPQQHPGIVPGGLVPVITLPDRDRPDRHDQVPLPGLAGLAGR
jgi:hypothetical protein